MLCIICANRQLKLLILSVCANCRRIIGSPPLSTSQFPHPTGWPTHSSTNSVIIERNLLDATSFAELVPQL